MSSPEQSTIPWVVRAAGTLPRGVDVSNPLLGEEPENTHAVVDTGFDGLDVEAFLDIVTKADGVLLVFDGDEVPLEVEENGFEIFYIEGCERTFGANYAVPDADWIHKAVWDSGYRTALPDSAFLYILPGGKKDDEGKTTPRSLRMFPYKDKEGKVDLPHLRNALARIPQSNRIPPGVKERLSAKARKILADQKEDTRKEESQPAEPSERRRGSSTNPPGSAASGVGVKVSPETETALRNKVQEHNEEYGKTASKKVTLGMLKAVYRRGAGAFSTSHRPSQNRASWSMARVNAFLKLVASGKPKNPKYVQDNDLLPKGHARSTRKSDIAKAGKYDHINFKPPESVANAAERGLALRDKAGGKGGLSTSQASREGVGSGVARAASLKNRQTLSPETVRRMKAFFDRHEGNKAISPENKGTPWKDAGYVAWLLWGGDPGRSWAEKVVRQMEAADDKAKTTKSFLDTAVLSKPFAGFDNFDACVISMQAQGHGHEEARKMCGRMQADDPAHKGDLSFGPGSPGYLEPEQGNRYLRVRTKNEDLINGVGLLRKSAEVIKNPDGPEERYILGVVLEPDVRDAQSDKIAAEEIRRAAHRYMEGHGNVGLQHQAFVNDKVKILESYIAPVDMVIGGQQVRKGTWLMAFRVLDDSIWKAIKDGLLTGLSIGGTGLRIPIA